MPKPGPKVILRDLLKFRIKTNLLKIVKNVFWSNVILEKDPEEALVIFFMPLVEKRAPL